MRPRAFCLIQSAVHYRRDAFEVGLKARGFSLEGGRHIGVIRPSDLLVIWNRYGRGDDLASQFEKAGSAVIVVENGYIGASENAYAKQFATKEQRPDSHLYTLSLNHHNGAGTWWIGWPDRWRQQGIEVKPWRTAGEHVLILPQRGIGPAGVAMPQDWPEKTLQRLRTLTKRSVRVRAHPGNEPAQRPLEADLEACWCAVTWGSGAAIKALCAGVPVFCDWRQWIGAPAASVLRDSVETPMRCDDCRTRMLDRLAWAQWTIAEIATGEPIRLLLERHATRAKAA